MKLMRIKQGFEQFYFNTAFPGSEHCPKQCIKIFFDGILVDATDSTMVASFWPDDISRVCYEHGTNVFRWIPERFLEEVVDN